jgi:energy-coupling factor transporter ATP-binding protein EcfA2
MNYRQLLKLLTSMPRSKSLLIRGHIGIGKSSLVSQAASIMTAKTGKPTALVDIRLSQQDVGDLRGIPYLVGGNTFFAPPMWYPIDPGYLRRQKEFLKAGKVQYVPWQTHEQGIIFLDELNRASREVLQCSFELTLDHKLGGVPIPPGWLVVAAVNHDQRVYQVHKLDPAHINRFLVVDFDPEVDEWLDYARVRTKAGQMHPAVVEYLQAHPSKLDPASDDLEQATHTGAQVATRRSWTTLAEVLREDPEFQGAGEDPEYQLSVIRSCIGDLHAASFYGFLVNRKGTLSPEDIVTDWDERCANHIRNLVDQGRGHELVSTTISVLNFLGKHKDVPLDPQCAANMAAFFELLPDGVAADLYSTWRRKQPTQARSCYDYRTGQTYPLKQRLLRALKVPDARG